MKWMLFPSIVLALLSSCLGEDSNDVDGIASSVIINEFCNLPREGEAEWVELKNISNRSACKGC